MSRESTRDDGHRLVAGAGAGAGASAASRPAGEGVPVTSSSSSSLAAKVASVRLTMGEIVSFVDSHAGLCAMSAACVAWRDGVRRAPVALGERETSKTILRAGRDGAVKFHEVGSFRRSFPQASALRVEDDHRAVPELDWLEALCGMVSLRRLELTGAVDDADVAGLLSGAGALTGLTALNLAMCDYLSEATAERLAALSQLTELGFSTRCLVHGGCASIARLTGLRALSLECASNCQLVHRRDAYSVPYDCEEPEGGEFGQCVCTIGLAAADLITMVGGLTSLTELRLTGFNLVSGAALSAIAAMPALTSLRLWGVDGPEGDPPRLECLRGATGLTKLDLGWCVDVVKDEGMAALRGMTGVRELDLYGCDGVTDAGMASLADHLPQLASLDLSHTSITAATLLGLQARTSLTHLRLGTARLAVSRRSLVALDALEALQAARGSALSVEVSTSRFFSPP